MGDVDPLIRRIALRVEEREFVDVSLRLVCIYVDGKPWLNGSTRAGFVGFMPQDILGPASPLLPAEPPRRVAVYRCGCGEGGCGCVAPVISQKGQLVVWSDFRDFTGVYTNPTADGNPEGGRPVPIPELAFDIDQYRMEIQRASTDYSWETPPLTVARLLTKVLSRDDPRLLTSGWRLSRVWPDHRRTGIFVLSFEDDRERQLVVELTAPTGSPQQQADEMAGWLLGTAPEDWPVVFRGGWLAAWKE
jgi:hypothetical protein